MTPQQNANAALSAWQALPRHCACGDKLLPAERERGVCDPCAGVPSARPESVARSIAATLLLACTIAVLFVAAGAFA